MDVISLLEVVNSVASQVPIPEDWDNRLEMEAGIPKGLKIKVSENSSERLDKLTSDLLDGLFKLTYRHSFAAGGLDCYLHEEDPNDLAWFDVGQTGWQKKSIKARTDGLEILVYMSLHFERYIKAFKTGRFNGWPKVNNLLDEDAQFARKEDSQRLKEIGFERSQIIKFLNNHKIPHSLTLPSNNQRDLLHSHGLDSGIEQESIAVNNAFLIEAGQSERSKIHRINAKRHILADLIEKAQAQAGVKGEDPKEVYFILTQMAQSTTPPIPLLEFVKGKGIKYQSGEIIKPYTLNALKKYLNPALRGKKKDPPTKLADK